MSNPLIDVEHAEYSYKSHNEGSLPSKAVDDIRIEIPKGQFVVIIGRNGSGKSTFARLINALLLPDKGTVYVNSLNTLKEADLWEIRRTAGMVFQNPDNQIIGNIVEEDVAFGPENLGVQPDEIKRRVKECLEIAGISEYSLNAPHLLSGGQKQRVAIAGILAMKPQCILLDEATSMLDPIGRREVMRVLEKLNKEEKITILHITHYMDEAFAADRVIIFDKGTIVLDGSPGEVFSNVRRIKDLGLDVPQVTELFYELNREGCNLPSDILDIDTAAKVLSNVIRL